MNTTDVPSGLRGVPVTDTTIGDVRGLEGFYHYRQYSATDLASHRSFEDVWRLLVDGELPLTATQQHEFERETLEARSIPDGLAEALPLIASASSLGNPLDGLRSALSIFGSIKGMKPLWDLGEDDRRSDLIALGAVTPVLAAALHRLRQGLEPVHPTRHWVTQPTTCG